MNGSHKSIGFQGAVGAGGFPNQAVSSLLRVPPKNPALVVGWWLLALELLIAYSRFFDVILSGYHIPAAVYALLIAFLLVSGAIFRIFSSPVAWFALGFTVWVCVTLPFSVWKTGSLDSVNRALQCLIIFVAVSSLAPTAKDCIRMLYVLGIATALGALLGFFFASMESGRLEMVSGSFRDPNEYAMTMLMGLPLLAFMVRTGNTAVRIAAVGMMVLNVLIFLETGSRGGMIALLVMGFILFWSVSPAKKIAVAIVAVVLIPLSFLILPSYLQKRYFTFFEADESGPMSSQERMRLQGADVASTEGRMELLLASLKLTAEHPLFGVGPGNFPVAYFDESKAAGVRVAWNVNHNTYTQLSCETGIPGALMFIAFLLTALTRLNRVVKTGAARGQPELAKAAYHLWLSLVAVCAAGFFLSLGYSAIFYVLAGLALAFDRVVSSSEKSLQPAPVFVRASGVNAPPLAIPAVPKRLPRSMRRGRH